MSPKYFWLEFALPERRMDITKTNVALCNCLWTRLKRLSTDKQAYFVYYSLLFFFAQKIKETYISGLSEALYLSDRSNCNFTREHFT
jgi:hypothetical protein